MQPSYNDVLPPVPTSIPNRRGLSKRTVYIGGLLLLALIVGSALLIASSNDGLKKSLQRLTVRLEVLQSMTNDAREAIVNPDLAKINSDASILVTGSIASLEKPMVAAGRGSVTDDNKKAEADTATLETLKQAKLTGNFDTTFARVLGQKIDTVLALLAETYGQTNSVSLKSALDHEYTNFKSIKEELSKLKL
ncbi:MAG TPA: hypothetical protein VFZ48_04680 [Candidatus Saccharimonadales bacterium]